MLEINNKSNENCVSIVDNCIKNIKSMKDDFDQFASFCSRNSEVCKYWEGCFKSVFFDEKFDSM